MNNNILKKSLKKYLEEFSETAYCLWQKGWAEGNAGNISVNITGELSFNKEKFNKFIPVRLKKQYPYLRNNLLFITASGSRMRDIAIGDTSGLLIICISGKGDSFKIIGISLRGDIISPKSSPTSELATHLAVHNFIKENNYSEKSLLHTHCTELISLTHFREFKRKERINKLLFEMHPEVKLFLPSGAGFVPFIPSGTEKIAIATIKEFQNHKIVLWEKHGCLAVGRTLGDSLDLIDVASKAARIYFTIKTAGYILK